MALTAFKIPELVVNIPLDQKNNQLFTEQQFIWTSPE